MTKYLKTDINHIIRVENKILFFPSFLFTIQFVRDLGKSKGMDQNENHTLSFTPSFIDDLVKEAEAAYIFNYSINELGEKEHA